MTETVALSFRDADELDSVDKQSVHDLSAVAAIGRTLFCASNETATVGRLLLDPASGSFGQHRNVAIGRYFGLPGGPDGEMDIEGLAVADGMLWITGSQGLKRKKLKHYAEGFHALDAIRWDVNRGFLGRIPLVETGDGCYDLAEPGVGRAACMAMDPDGRTALRKALGRDPILKPFMDVPCKENGFDVEGIAVAGSHVFLGLRGPTGCSTCRQPPAPTRRKALRSWRSAAGAGCWWPTTRRRRTAWTTPSAGSPSTCSSCRPHNLCAAPAGELR